MSRCAILRLYVLLLIGTTGQILCQCPTPTVRLDVPTPTLNPVAVGDKFISGTLPAGTAGTVQVCLAGTPQGAPQPVAVDGRFVVAPLAAIVVNTDVTAQFINGAGASGPPVTIKTRDSCAGSASKAAGVPSQPSLTVTASGSYSGSVPSATGGSVRICLSDVPVPAPAGVAAIGTDGTFKGSGLKADVNTSVTAQAATAAAPTVYGVPSNSVPVPPAPTSGTSVLLIGGVEQSGYSSLGLNTSPFINFFIQGPVAAGFSGWGRIRLLGAPQPSTQGIVSTFTDPTGQLTTQDYSKVGTSMDFVAGGSYKLSEKDSADTGWSFIADIGSTTPLSSQSVALTYKAPAPGTVECSTLTGRFTVAKGYAPGLTQAPTGSTTCLAGGYTDVSFSNQDRSSFLRKWGVGVRSSAKFPCPYPNCPAAYGVLDITLGQDEAITRGLLRHFVFKMDGVLPISIKGSSLLYLFGSAYLRTSRNQDLSPLILMTETATVTIPSSTVIVLPLQQPDRDFYRLGVGLNLSQIFCKMFDCPTAPAAPAK